jgi:hypothetical protein
MGAPVGQRDPFAEWEEHNQLPASQDGSRDQTELMAPLPVAADRHLPTLLTRFVAPGYSGEEMELFRRRLRSRELKAAALVGLLGVLLGVAVFFLAFSRLQAPQAEPWPTPAPQVTPRPRVAPRPVQGPPEVTPFEGELAPLPSRAPVAAPRR